MQNPTTTPSPTANRYFTARRLIGLVALAVLAAWPILRSCSPQEPEVSLPPPPVREEFHASKPLRLDLKSADAHDSTWLQYELNHLLARGKMHVAPVSIDAAANSEAFTLRVTMNAEGKQATLALIAPDNFVERKLAIPLPRESRLATVQTFAQALPGFLDAAHATGQWVTLLGTEDAKAYETFLNSSLEWSGPDGPGFTQPPPAPRRSPAVERLEALVRSQPQFARALGALAVGYLSLGGEDESSLTELAESHAERALALDKEIADAHATLGLVHLRRSEWVAARERFVRALTLDARTAAALEGLACLLVDAGRHEEAAPFAAQAVSLQPRNRAARECFAYTLTDSKPSSASKALEQPSVVQALEAILAGDTAAARELLRSSISAQQFTRWGEPLLRAADNRRHIPRALQAVTLAASEQQIDPATEILCGAALQQPEFVFNRMSRLQRQGERPPLRVLWMPQTKFLREHPRFEPIVSGAGLPAFWQERGVADVCAAEPELYGCKFRAGSPRSTP